MSREARVFLGLVALVGVGCMLFAVLVIRPMTIQPYGWVTVQGRVVDEQVEESPDGVVFYPIVEYADGNGASHRVVSNLGSSSHQAVGRLVTVAYDPGQPEDAWVGGSAPATVWVLPALIGALFAVLPMLILVRSSSAGSGPQVPGATEQPTRWSALPESMSAARHPAARSITRERDGRDVFYRSGLLSWTGGWFGAVERPTVAVVGPDGISVRGLERLAWADIAEIHVERIPSMQARGYRYRRLGIVPRDPMLAAGRPLGEQAAWMAVRPLLVLAAAKVDEAMPALAPFGVEEQDMGRDAFDGLLASVQRYHPIAAAPQPAQSARRLPGSLRSLRLAQGAFVVGIALRLLVPRLLPAGAAGPSGFLWVLAALPVLALTVMSVRELRRRGMTPREAASLAAVLVGGLAVGAALPGILGFGLSS